MEVVICLVVMVLFIAGMLARYIYIQSKRVDIQIADTMTFETVLDVVQKRLADLLKEDGSKAKDDIEYQATWRQLQRIEAALTECIDGKEGPKIIVKELIVSILKEMFPTPEKLHTVFPFDGWLISSHWEFEILMERLFKDYGKDSLSYLVHKYDWDKPRYDIEDGTVPVYGVSEEDLHEAYVNEIVTPLTFREELSVAATLVYEKLKGMGIVDTLRTMNINGFNIGTSGSIMNVSSTNPEANDWKAYQSVWLYFEGKFIHLRFLSFDSEAEIRRVVQLIARYNNPGPLTEKKCYIVNTMEDKSRVLALRPPACEYWACFVRKFVLSSATLEYLVNPQKRDDTTKEALFDEQGNPVPKYKNAELPLNLIKLLMEGQVTTAFTGRQGSGKTTMMTAAIQPVDARFTIRVLEMAPEMYLRELYPRRNILSVQETAHVTAAELQDALKKSDAALSIVGEVATDVIAARMLQMAQVASIFTIFSHHANRTSDLVNAITNSVVAASNGSATYDTVLPQVIEAIHVDVHLDYDVSGNRYIERVTEIVRLDDKPYPEREPGEDVTEYQVRLQKEFFIRTTDRKMFDTIDILVFDTRTWEYKAANWFSPELSQHIMSRVEKDHVEKWANFILENWGGTADVA